jgi:hypothetical protein
LKSIVVRTRTLNWSRGKDERKTMRNCFQSACVVSLVQKSSVAMEKNSFKLYVKWRRLVI